MEATKCLKPPDSSHDFGDCACAGRNVSEREQTSKRTMCRPARRPFRGRPRRLGEKSEEYAQPQHRGSGDSMYKRKAHATGETPMRDQG
jgi:hypothetical protein